MGEVAAATSTTQCRGFSSAWAGTATAPAPRAATARVTNAKTRIGFSPLIPVVPDRLARRILFGLCMSEGGRSALIRPWPGELPVTVVVIRSPSFPSAIGVSSRPVPSLQRHANHAVSRERSARPVVGADMTIVEKRGDRRDPAHPRQASLAGGPNRADRHAEPRADFRVRQGRVAEQQRQQLSVPVGQFGDSLANGVATFRAEQQILRAGGDDPIDRLLRNVPVPVTEQRETLALCRRHEPLGQGLRLADRGQVRDQPQPHVRADVLGIGAPHAITTANRVDKWRITRDDFPPRRFQARCRTFQQSRDRRFAPHFRPPTESITLFSGFTISPWPARGPCGNLAERATSVVPPSVVRRLPEAIGMEFRLFGEVQLQTGGRSLDVGTPRQQAVLAALAVDVGRPVAIETIVDRVWHDAPPVEARNVLYSHLSRIRQLLKHVEGVTIDRRTAGYVLDVDPDRVDLHRFTRLVEHGVDPGRPAEERSALLTE